MSRALLRVAAAVGELAGAKVAQSAGRASRELLELLGAEVEAIVAPLGLGGRAERAELEAQLSAARARVGELESELAGRGAADHSRRASTKSASRSAASRAPTKRAATKPAATKQAATKQAATKQAATKQAATKRATTKRASTSPTSPGVRSPRTGRPA